MKIKTGDTVVVIAGRDQFTVDKKGVKTRKTGRALKVLRDETKVIVAGVNTVKKHARTKTQIAKGGIVDVPAPIPVSNVATVGPKTNKPPRGGYRIENGVNVRYAKKSGSLVG